MSQSEDNTADELDVVLFGVGDLRMDDHEGLAQALTGKKVLPLIILNDLSISNIPGVVSHTIDTANMVVEAVKDLKSSLKEKLDLDLQVVSNTQSLPNALVEVVEQHSNSNTQVRVHVHDLGDADNAMGYGPFSQLQGDTLANMEVVLWTCHLRSKPWKKVESIPDRYPDFQVQYTVTDPLLAPVSVEKGQVDGKAKIALANGAASVPTADELVDRLQTILKLDPAMVKAEVNTGIFQSHWGGLDASTVGESKVQQNLKVFVEDCQEEDELWAKHPTYVAKECPRNKRSIEHAVFNWMLRGTSGGIETNNLLAGEPMTRYLSAPLLLGTISPRRLWHLSTRGRPLFVSPLKTLAEGREWHKLLAAKNMRTRPEYKPSESVAEDGMTRYGYWRWHGFLCRYAQTPLATPKTAKPDCSKEGVLLIHGFGASGSQWNKAMKELSNIVTEEASDETTMEGLAPDLIGFGQSEKPPISYSIYVWDSQCSDFVKEVAVARRGWGSYIVGGNSIGGFSAASTAANECAKIDDISVCSSGAPGTSKCQGVVLMNPAGPIQSREEVQKIEEMVNGDTSKLATVAQITALGALPPW